MILTYNEFDGKNLEEEIEKIKASDLVNVRISTKDKGLLFLLGILFAAGKKLILLIKRN